MKKFKIIAVFLLLLSLSMFAMACSDTEDEPGGTGEITVTLNTQTLVLERWAVGKLTATVGNGEGKTISWSSSAPSVASVDGEGNVNALEVGTAVITAQVEDASATCNVTVTESSESPFIMVSQTEAEPAVGGSVTVTATLDYKGEAQDAVFSWVSDDEKIATVENGVITGVGIGKTTVTVSADFHGEKVSRNISVIVKENASIGLDKSAIELYASDPSGKGGYKTSEQITATVFENDEEVSSPFITWASSDTAVAVYADGVISAVGYGTATVTASWTSSRGTEFTATVTVTVSIPVLALEAEGLYEQYTGISGTTPTANTADLTIDLTSAIGDALVSLSDVSFTLIDNTGAQTALSGVSVSRQSITIPHSELENLLGEYTLAITVSNKVSYTLPVTVATKLISTTADLQNMPYYGGIADKNSQAAYGGYFVMTQNVNMDETKFSNASWMNAPSSVGFQGTFDGRGYSVIGGTYERGGIFLTVGQNGVVKNVAFVGGTVKGGWSHYPVLAQNFYGELNNVFIGNVENTGSSLGALIGSNVDAKLTNVVIYANKGLHGDSGAVAVTLGTNISAENVYVFSDILNSDGSVKIANQGATTGLEGLQAYTFDQIGTEDVSVSGLTTYWDTTTFDIPVFDSSVEYLQGTGFLGYTAEA